MIFTVSIVVIFIAVLCSVRDSQKFSIDSFDLTPVTQKVDSAKTSVEIRQGRDATPQPFLELKESTISLDDIPLIRLGSSDDGAFVPTFPADYIIWGAIDSPKLKKDCSAVASLSETQTQIILSIPGSIVSESGPTCADNKRDKVQEEVESSHRGSQTCDNLKEVRQ